MPHYDIFLELQLYFCCPCCVSCPKLHWWHFRDLDWDIVCGIGLSPMEIQNIPHHWPVLAQGYIKSSRGKWKLQKVRHSNWFWYNTSPHIYIRMWSVLQWIDSAAAYHWWCEIILGDKSWKYVQQRSAFPGGWLLSCLGALLPGQTALITSTSAIAHSPTNGSFARFPGETTSRIGESPSATRATISSA